MSIHKAETTPKDAGQKVVIRAAEPADYDALHEIYAQPRSYAGTLQLPFPSAQLWRERLAQDNAERRMLVACVNDRPVGNIGLVLQTNPRRRHAASLGMGVHDAYAGRGIGAALMDAALHLADNWLNISRVELTVFADNDRAIRLYRRTGFEVEGTFKNYAFRDGSLVDALAMARCR